MSDETKKQWELLENCAAGTIIRVDFPRENRGDWIKVDERGCSNELNGAWCSLVSGQFRHFSWLADERNELTIKPKQEG